MTFHTPPLACLLWLSVAPCGCFILVSQPPGGALASLTRGRCVDYNVPMHFDLYLASFQLHFPHFALLPVGKRVKTTAWVLLFFSYVYIMILPCALWPD